MTKQAKNKNKIISIFQILFIIIGLLLQYFTKKKMGVQRTLIYYNYNLENNYHIKLIYILVAILFLKYIIYKWFKYKYISPISIISIFAILILVLVDINIFKLTKYAISSLLILVNILELFKRGEIIWKDQTNYLHLC